MYGWLLGLATFGRAVGRHTTGAAASGDKAILILTLVPINAVVHSEGAREGSQWPASKRRWHFP